MSGAAACAILTGAAQSRANINITPTFDPTITADPNASTIESTVNTVIQTFQNDIGTNINVSILFKEDPNIDLGQSSTYTTTESYTDYRAALQSHATTADDFLALVHLPVPTPANPNNPVNNATPDIGITLPLARALGFNPYTVQFDSTVSLNTTQMNLSRTGTQDPSKYDLFATAAHEIDEVLGTSSNLDHNNSPSTSAVNAADLFRYDASGNRIYSTDPSAVSYFSIDGTTKISQYNQDPGGDLGDWFSVNGGQTPQVQDAFATAGAQPNLGNELRVLDVVGYTPASVPEPASLGLAGLSALCLLARRRRTA